MARPSGRGLAARRDSLGKPGLDFVLHPSHRPSAQVHRPGKRALRDAQINRAARQAGARLDGGKSQYRVRPCCALLDALRNMAAIAMSPCLLRRRPYARQRLADASHRLGTGAFLKAFLAAENDMLRASYSCSAQMSRDEYFPEDHISRIRSLLVAAAARLVVPCVCSGLRGLLAPRDRPHALRWLPCIAVH